MHACCPGTAGAQTKADFFQHRTTAFQCTKCKQEPHGGRSSVFAGGGLVLVDALQLVLLGGETLPLALLGTDSVADLRGRVTGMFAVMMGDVAFVEAIGGGAIIDDTDCICRPVDHWIAAASVSVDHGVSLLELYAATRVVRQGFLGRPLVTAENAATRFGPPRFRYAAFHACLLAAAPTLLALPYLHGL